MIIRIPRAAVPSGADGSPDLSTILARLAPVGTLAKTAGKLSGSAGLGSAGTGLAGLLTLGQGIANKDPGQAIGGAANVGSGLAGLVNYPGVSSALGAIGGPLTLATGLAKGDPLSSTLGGLQTASLASGYLGGPTLSSLATSASGLLPGAAESALAGAGSASELGLGAAGLGAGAGATGLLAMAPLAPFAIMLGGALSSALGKHAEHAARQTKEYNQYAQDFPDLVKRRTAGAALYNQLDEELTPEQMLQALAVAGSGRNANTEPAAYNLSHRPSATHITPMDLSGWESKATELGGHNWAAFQNLMDRGEAAGIDPGGHTGAWNLNPAGFSDLGEMRGPQVPEDTNRTGEDYRTVLGYNNQAQTERVLDPATQQYSTRWLGGARGQTQEAQDFGNAVGGIGKDLGVDFSTRGGDPGDWQNFDPEQLAGYGVTPGQYGPAALNYLRSFDPTVTERPKWASYAQALDPGNALADLDPLTLTPRKPVTYYNPLVPDLNVGGF